MKKTVTKKLVRSSAVAKNAVARKAAPKQVAAKTKTMDKAAPKKAAPKKQRVAKAAVPLPLRSGRAKKKTVASTLARPIKAAAVKPGKARNAWPTSPISLARPMVPAAKQDASPAEVDHAGIVLQDLPFHERPDARFDPTPDTNTPLPGHTASYDRGAQNEQVAADKGKRARINNPGRR